jgi:cysteine desulfurase
MEKRIYVDNAATTRLSPLVLDEMLPYLKDIYGNPSSIYEEGQEAKSAVEMAREKIAQILGAAPDEIFFTSGGSESDNWAIYGIAHANVRHGKHIITSKIEHHAVLHTCQALEKEGFEVTYLDVDENGLISLDDLRNAIRGDTTLITIMYANNEIGTIQPIKEIGEVALEKGVIFHTDAVQAIGNVEIDVKDLHVDAMSLTAHKFCGPKGVGALYVKHGTPISNFIHGGAQEKNRRGGTENVAGIVGMAEALELATRDIPAKVKKLAEMRDMLIEKVMENIDYVRLNGHPTQRLAGNVNFSFEFIEGESLLLMLNAKGISASSGSACTSGSLDPSHVLLAIGLPHEVAHGSLRVTFGENNKIEDVDQIFEALTEIVPKLRSWSPLYNEKMKIAK